MQTYLKSNKTEGVKEKEVNKKINSTMKVVLKTSSLSSTKIENQLINQIKKIQLNVQFSTVKVVKKLKQQQKKKLISKLKSHFNIQLKLAAMFILSVTTFLQVMVVLTKLVLRADLLVHFQTSQQKLIRLKAKNLICLLVMILEKVLQQ